MDARTAVIRELREAALGAFRAALDAVDPGRLLGAAVGRTGDGRITVAGLEVPRARGRVVVAAVGKAAGPLAAGWLRHVPVPPETLFVLAPHGAPVPGEAGRSAIVRRGSHPEPDAAGEAATLELLELAAGLGPGDLLVVLLSGGASALLAAPEPPATLEDVRAVTRALLRAGAPIGALNAVRRWLLRAAGGGLARTAAPARVLGLVLSDVPGDPLPDIGSGPTVPSPTPPSAALAVLERYGVLGEVPERAVRVLRRLEAERAAAADREAAVARTALLGGNRTAVAAAADWLRGAGYGVWTPQRPLTGEASVRGRQLGALAGAFAPREPFAAVFGGETTVTVRGNGSGGRNHELALAAAIELADGPPRVVLAAGTDGVDGTSGAAGALADPGTAARLRAAGIDPREALLRNDSGPAMAAAGDAVVTGPTGTNVADLTLLLAAEP